jgi:predicted AAA+ superfamily ATPase
MIRRYLQDEILGSLKHFPVVLLTGARQVGKSTLAQELIDKHWKARYLTLDDRAVLDAALRDPDGLVSGTPPPVVFDEVQRAPDLMRAIKRAVDRRRDPGRYLLTGSANIQTLSSAAESLAGRVAVHTLYPFSWPEILGRPKPAIFSVLFDAKNASELLTRFPRSSVSDRTEAIIQSIEKGGYPIPALMASASARSRWFSSYRQTYLERDVLNIKFIENLPDFNRLLTLAASRTGRLLNLSDLSRETGLPFTTLRRHMNLLSVTYQIFLLNPYFSNIGKRLVKTSKLYFSDTGMASHLIAVDNWPNLEQQGQIGHFVETWAAIELKKLISVTDERIKLYFWRTQTGQEVDFLLEKAGKLIGIEVKWASRIDSATLNNLERCAEVLGSRYHLSIILYRGTETVSFSPKIVALPFSLFFGID